MLSKERVYEAQRTLYPSDGSSMIERAKHSLHRSKQLQREALQQMQKSTVLKGKLQQQEQNVEGIKRTIFETGQLSNNITSQMQSINNGLARRLAQESMELAQRTSDEMHAELRNARKMQNSIQAMRKSFAMLEPDWEIKVSMAEENISLTKTNLRVANVSLTYLEQQASKEQQIFEVRNKSIAQQLQQLRDQIAKARHAAEAVRCSFSIIIIICI